MTGIRYCVVWLLVTIAGVPAQAQQNDLFFGSFPLLEGTDLPHRVIERYEGPEDYDGIINGDPYRIIKDFGNRVYIKLPVVESRKDQYFWAGQYPWILVMELLPNITQMDQHNGYLLHIPTCRPYPYDTIRHLPAEQIWDRWLIESRKTLQSGTVNNCIVFPDGHHKHSSSGGGFVINRK